MLADRLPFVTGGSRLAKVRDSHGMRGPAATEGTLGRARPIRPEVQVTEGPGVRIGPGEDAGLFLLVAVFGIAAGLWTAVGVHLHYPDNLARTLDAVQVLYGYEPKLANIGFIWAPLPALLQLPLVALLPGIAFEGGTGTVVSSLAGAVCLVLLNRILAPWVSKRRYRYPLLLIYQLNPLVIYLIITGMSEMLVLMFVLLAWLAFQRVYWEEPLPFIQIGVMGTAMAGAVLSRYEGLAFALALGGWLVATTYLLKRPRRWLPTEGLLLAYAMPWSYAFGLWLFFNAMIMKNPLHFATGKGSHSEHASYLLSHNATLAGLVGDAPGSAAHSLHAAWDVAPVFVLALPLALGLAVLRRDLFLLATVGVALSFTMMQALLYLTGGSLGWLRYHVYLAAFAPILLGYCARPGYFPWPAPGRFLSRWGRHAWPVTAALVLLLGAWSASMTWHGLEDPAFVPDNEPAFLRAVAAGPQPEAPTRGRDIGVYLRDRVFRANPAALVLMDDQQADEIILSSAHPGRFVTPGVSCFRDYLADPSAYVTHLLVPEKAWIGSDIVLQAYPELFDRGATYAALEEEFVTPVLRWRLYSVQAGEGSPPDACPGRA